MEKTVKLIADITFHDRASKRNITQGVMFYTDSERAVLLVSGGFASIVERPKPVEDKPKEKPVEKVTEVKPVATVKRQAARKPVKK